MKMHLRDITSHLNRRIRCIIWKQWKTPKHRTKRLMQLGLDKDTAKSCSYSRKSYWCTSMCVPIHKAISNKRLQQKGLVFPLEHYLKVHTEI